MLVNNPMGSRRRRRFYHRAGVVPGPGGGFKTGLPVIDFFRFEPELHVQEEVEEQIEEREYHLIPRINQGGKRRVNIITVSSLHTRLLEIVDSMISLAEQEDRENAKLNNSRKATDEDIGQPAAAAASAADQRTAPDAEQYTAPTAQQPMAPAVKQPTAPATDQPTAPAAVQPAAPAAGEAATIEIIIDGDGAQSSN